MFAVLLAVLSLGLATRAAPTPCDRAKLEAYIARQSLAKTLKIVLPDGRNRYVQEAIFLLKQEGSFAFNVDITLAEKESPKEGAFGFRSKSGKLVVVELKFESDQERFYEIFFSPDTPKEEIVTTTLDLFVRAKHYQLVKVGYGAFADAVFGALSRPNFIRADALDLEDTGSSVGLSEPTLLKLIQTLQPTALEAIISNVGLSDSFFRDSIVRKLKMLKTVGAKTTMTDDTMAGLEANELDLGEVKSLTQKGLRRWLNAVVNGTERAREVYFAPPFTPDAHLVDGLDVISSNTKDKEGLRKRSASWLIKRVCFLGQRWQRNVSTAMPSRSLHLCGKTKIRAEQFIDGKRRLTEMEID